VDHARHHVYVENPYFTDTHLLVMPAVAAKLRQWWLGIVLDKSAAERAGAAWPE
jgi:hypothetical protein